MKKTLQTLRYLSKSFKLLTAIGFLSILGSLAISYLIFYLTDRYNPVPHPLVTVTAPFEITAATFAVLIGLLLFIANFKVALANGISRRTFLLANIPAALASAAAFAIFNQVLLSIYGLFLPIQSITDLIYPAIGWAGSLIFQFSEYLLLILAGWFVTLAYYRCSTLGKWIISLAPFVLIALVQIADARTGGAISAAISDYQHATLQMDWAAFTLLAYSILLCGLVFLLIRRAPLKD